MKNKPVSLLCVGIGGYAEVYLRSLLEEPRAPFAIAGMVEVAPDRCKYYETLTAARHLLCRHRRQPNRRTLRPL